MMSSHSSTDNVSEAINVLRKQLGHQVVLLPDEFVGRYHADSSRTPCAEPLALVRPRSTEEVATALKICHEYFLPVVTQGGLTGLAGGAALLGGEIVLSLEKMAQIEEIDTISSTMTVQAGAMLQTIQEAADEADLFFPLDLGARGSCSIGGNLATNAGGNRVIKYGMTRDLVLDVEAVLADGSIVGGTRKMIKNNTGYDLRNLFIGSEGTLAVITRVVLKLHPKPRAISTTFCGLPDFNSVTTLLSKLQSRFPSSVSAFEVMWPDYYDFVLEKLPHLRKPLSDRHAFYVLLEVSGADENAQNSALELLLEDLFEEEVISDAAIAMSQADALDFWAIRDAPGEYGRYLPGRVSFDVSFAISEVEAAIEQCHSLLREKWPEATILFYGHLGDGNIHIQVHEDRWGAEAPQQVQKLVYGVVHSMGGSISAEHGVGVKRKQFLPMTRSRFDIDAMKAIKVALDPRGILNPGKIFDV